MIPFLFVLATAISIQTARLQSSGVEVVVEGVVTVPSGAFRSATGESGFAIQQGSAGIYVQRRQTDSLSTGQRVRVSGIIKDDGNGLLVIAGSRIERLTGSATTQPLPIRASEAGEQTEGQLVRVKGRITRLRPDPPYGTGVFIDDGSGMIQVYLHHSAPIEAGRLRIGQTITAIGFSGQYKEFIEVYPRTESDVR